MFKNTIREQLKVPAHVDYLAELRDFVTRIGRKHGISDKSINAFKLAIDEAGTNIIRHAYRGFDEPGFILLRVIVRKASVTISLIDQGKYFDPRGVRDPDLKRYVEIGKKGGLGIFIIRKLMDEIDYRKTEEGNELRLTKYHDTTRKMLVRKMGNIPLSFKAKYFVRTALVLTLFVVAGYAFLYHKAGVTIRTSHLDDLYSFGEQYVASLSQNAGVPGDPVETTKAVVTTYEENRNWIYEIIIVDNDGMITGYIDTTKYLSDFPPLPPDAKQRRDKVLELDIAARPPSQGEVAVYSYVSPIAEAGSGQPKGELHIRIVKKGIDLAVATRRWDDGRVALLILLASYFGGFILIYILLNPFRKLSDWVRAMDHGDEVEDEMDIDSSTEIGEIAKAFSEITTKFRESQKNLAEQEQLQKEMQVAQEIQQTLLPTDFPELEGYELSSLYQAAKEVGGDYYDFVEVDKDTLGIVVADVSGKGVPGSLVMTMIRTALRTEARGVLDAAEVLSRVNNFVVNDMKKGMFVTIFYVIIDSKRRRLNYASAGHNPMILYRPSTKKTYYLNPKGFPIGIQLAEKDLFRMSIESDTIQLAEEDILILYTDGVTEAMNRQRDLFGEERYLKVIREHGHLRVKPFVERLQEEIESFTEGGVQYDDITLVTIKEKTSPEKEELRRAKIAHKAIVDGTSIRDACETAGITTYAYYNKYKKQFEEFGIDSYEIDDEISVEAKHISIEDKTKIFDIIRNHPEYGAKRISEELGTEKYGSTQIPESKIYDELVRSRLNTRQLREAYVARGGRNRRRMKPPGTPLLTLDGRVIIDRQANDLPPPQDEGERRTRPDPLADKKADPPVEITRRPDPSDTADVNMDVISTPIEELLDNSKAHDDASDAVDSTDAITPEEQEAQQQDAGPEGAPDFEDLLTHGLPQSEINGSDASFEDLIAHEISTGFADPASDIILDDPAEPADSTPQDADQEEAAPVPEDDYSQYLEEPASEAGDGTDPGSDVEDSDQAQPEAEEPGQDLVDMADDGTGQADAGEIELPAALGADAEPDVDDELEHWLDGTDQESDASVLNGAADEGSIEPAADLEPTSNEELEPQPEDAWTDDVADSAEPEQNDEQPPFEETAGSLEQEVESDEDVPDSAKLGILGNDTIEILTGAGLQNIEQVPPPGEPEPPVAQDEAFPEIDDAPEPEEPEYAAESGPEAPEEPDETEPDPIAGSVETESEPDPEPWDDDQRVPDASEHQPASSDEDVFEAEPGTEATVETPDLPEDQVEEEAVETGHDETASIEVTAGGSEWAARRERERILISGLRFYRNQDFEKAIVQFEEVVSRYPDFKEAHSILGNAYFRTHKFDDAWRAYERVLRLDPSDTTARENIGVLLANQGRFDKAIEQWGIIVEQDSGRSDIQKKIKRAEELMQRGPVLSK